jgi:hypothetical protein
MHRMSALAAHKAARPRDLLGKTPWGPATYALHKARVTMYSRTAVCAGWALLAAHGKIVGCCGMPGHSPAFEQSQGVWRGLAL